MTPIIKLKQALQQNHIWFCWRFWWPWFTSVLCEKHYPSQIWLHFRNCPGLITLLRHKIERLFFVICYTSVPSVLWGSHDEDVIWTEVFEKQRVPKQLMSHVVVATDDEIVEFIKIIITGWYFRFVYTVILLLQNSYT